MEEKKDMVKECEKGKGRKNKKNEKERKDKQCKDEKDFAKNRL